MFSTSFASLIVFFLFSLYHLLHHYANVFVFGEFDVHYKDWLIYSARTDRPGELCYNFSTSNHSTQMVNLITQVTDCDSHCPALLNLFISLMLVFVLQRLSFQCEILIMWLPQFPLISCQT